MTSEFTVAIHGLVYLHHRERRPPAEVLAQNICTNPGPGAQGNGEIEKSRPCRHQRGRCGRLSKRAGARNGDAVRNCRGAGGAVCLFLLAQRRKGICPVCGLRHGRVMDALYQELDTLCRQRLSHITLADVAHKIFSGRAQQEPGA